MAAALLKTAAANPNLVQAATAQANSILKNMPTPVVTPKVTVPSGNSTVIQTVRTMNAGLCRIIAFIWDKLKIIFRFLFLTRSPAAYVVWLLIIIAIILGVAFGIHFGVRKKSTLAINKNVENSKIKKIKLHSSVLSEEPTNEGYRKKAIQQSVSGEPNKVDGYKRNLLSGGRCDGLNWITDITNKDSGKCLRTIPPAPIKWEFNSDEYKELGDIPETLLNTVYKKQLSVNIPYNRIGDKFYVDCKNMTYADGTKAKLFVQKNIKDNLCYYVERPAAVFEDEKRPLPPNGVKAEEDPKFDLYNLCPINQ